MACHTARQVHAHKQSDIAAVTTAAGGIACYTGRLLAKCINTSRAIRTYPDIGQAAFGRWGRLLVSVLLYMELFCCCVDFLILEGAHLFAFFVVTLLHL
jgi:vesicular inhibitory amino acid transporter